MVYDNLVNYSFQLQKYKKYLVIKKNTLYAIIKRVVDVAFDLWFQNLYSINYYQSMSGFGVYHTSVYIVGLDIFVDDWRRFFHSG